jgi:RNA polymerase-binding protein DksA
VTDLIALRKSFLARLAVLGARVHELEDDLRQPLEADSEERATQMEGDEVTSGLEHQALVEVERIQAAIRRIDAGEYGQCAKCGEPIGAKRLEALPTGAICMDCASG